MGNWLKARRSLIVFAGLLIVLLATPPSVLAQVPVPTSEPAPQVDISQLTSVERVDLLSRLSDEQMRELMHAYMGGRAGLETKQTPAYGLGYICKEAQPKVCVATHYSYDDIFNNETVAEVRHHFKGAFAFGAPDLVTFNIHGDGKVWWREGVAAESSQTPRPVFKSKTIRFPAPRHQPYDVINDTVEANEIDPKLWYPEGHMPELIREWPLTKDIEIPNPYAAPAE